MKNEIRRISIVAGARPNFMKVAPIWTELKKYPERYSLQFVHTGQHYDDNMSGRFLGELGLPEPDVSLGVGSGSHGDQTARIMIEYEKVVLKARPDLVLVVGDVNSTIACALVASKLWIPVAHVEAGLRSFDRTMPEEVNRVLTDQISDLHFITCSGARENLIKEGIGEEKIHFTGNVMIESLIRMASKIDTSTIMEQFNLKPGQYALTTLHRPSNVDDFEVFRGITEALDELGKSLPIIFPAHPRTQNRMRSFGLDGLNHHIHMKDPIGYYDFLALEKNARLVLTDSGGVQEETTYYGIPCLTLRENTERPVTITEGTNQLVSPQKDAIIKAAAEVVDNPTSEYRVPEKWDDQVSTRIRECLDKHFDLV